MENKTVEREYIAFISYRHLPLDQEAAETVQKKIEHFKVPKEFRDKAGGSSLGIVFRDEDELPVSSSLSSSIIYALDHSQFLIVICTPDLPESKWCETEIKYFIQKHGRNRVIAVLADGTPEESFPDCLRFEYDENGQRIEEVEPLAANIAGKDHSIDHSRLKKEIVRIYAALLGCPFDDLWQRQRRYRTRRLLLLAGVLICAMAVFMAVVISKNVQITAQNRELTLQQSYLLNDSGRMLLEQCDVKGARENALMALETEDGMPYDLKAERLLAEVNGAYEYQNIRKEKIYEELSEIQEITYGCQSDRLYISDQLGVVTCIDPEEGEALWTSTVNEYERGDATFGRTVFLRLSPDEQILYLFNTKTIKALKTENGETLWEHMMDSSSNCWSYEGDAGMIAFIESLYDDNYKTEQYLKIIDSSDGHELISFPADEDEEDVKWNAVAYDTGNHLDCGSFSSDRRFFGLVFLQNDQDFDRERCRAWVIDMETGKITLDKTWEIKDNRTCIIHGVYVSDDGNDLFAFIYDGGKGGIETRMMHGDSDEEISVFHEWVPSFITRLDYPGISDTLPLITSDYLAVSVMEDQVYLNLLSDGSWWGRWQLQGNAVGIDWLDRENEILWAVTDAGEMYRMDLSHEGEYAYEQISGYALDQGRQIYMAKKAEGYQMALLDEENPEKAFMYRDLNDPNFTLLLEKDMLTRYGDRAVILSPSGERLFVIDGVLDQPLTLYTFDTETMDLQETAVFDDIPLISYEESISAFSEDAVMYGFHIIHSDGTISYPEDMSEEYYEVASSLVRNAESVLLENGTNMAVTCFSDYLDEEKRDPDSKYRSYYLGRCWMNGVKNNVRLKMLNVLYSDYWLGENGLFVLYGITVTVEDGLISPDNEEDAFLVWNMKDESFRQFDDPFPESTRRIIATGKTEPVFVVADSDGCVRLFNTETNECTVLTDDYGTSLVKAMTFMDEDRYLALLTYAGGIDIYRIRDGERVCSLDEDLELSYEMTMKSYETGDGRVMLICGESDQYYGDALIIDTGTFDVTAKIRDVYLYIPEKDKIVVRRNQGDIGVFPLYDKEELIEMAAEKH